MVEVNISFYAVKPDSRLSDPVAATVDGPSERPLVHVRPPRRRQSRGGCLLGLDQNFFQGQGVDVVDRRGLDVHAAGTETII